MEEYDVLKTAVLIVGGGGAGVRAAIEAGRQDAEVCLVSKGPIAGSGLTPLAYPSLQAAFGAADPRDNPDVHYHDTIVEGRYLSDQNLARVLADESVQRALDLEEYGIRFMKRGGRFHQVHHPGQTYPRNLFIQGGGVGLIRGLKKELKRYSKVRVLEDFVVTRLLQDQNEVVGAFGLNLRNGRFCAISAGATVMACGGYEQLWGNTDATSDVTGDGVCLGFRAGADVIDLEMSQYYPAVFAHPESVRGLLVQYETFLGKEYLDFRMVNREGREILPQGPLPSRDVLMRRMFKEIEEGRGTERGGLYIDPQRSSRSREEVEKIIDEMLEGPCRNLKKLGIDVRRDPMEVCPAVHHTLGGIRINEKTETSVPGLFAAGENAGNLHGANRISGNALSETQVFGARAGKYACEWAKRRQRHPPLSTAAIEEWIQHWDQLLQRKRDGVRAVHLKKELNGVMDTRVGPNRGHDGLVQALHQVMDLRKNGMPAVEVFGGKVFSLDWRAAIEISMSLELAELVVRSAIFREESRGHHFRSDFPSASKMAQHTLVRKRGHAIELTFAPVTILSP